MNNPKHTITHCFSLKRLIAVLCVFTLALSLPVYVYAGTSPKASSAAKKTEYYLGDTVLFGHFEQDNDTRTDPRNEDISWIIIDKDEDYLLLLSEFALENIPYHSSGEPTTWADSKLRTWLNNTFLKTAFSSSELDMIAEASVPATGNYHYPKVDAGKSTNDKVFLLSVDEIEEYALEKSERKCAATKYAQGRGTWIDQNRNCCWWLRTPGNSNGAAAYVGASGDVVDKGFAVKKLVVGVRPAIWIKLPG